MNILPKKSWHVGSQKNIDRVERDERREREANEAKERRARAVENEARLALLRGRAGADDNNDDSGGGASRPIDPFPDNQHVNLFAEHEKATSSMVNREHELEARAERERQEQRLGILVKLGQSATGTSDSALPWYAKPPPSFGKDGDASSNSAAHDSGSSRIHASRSSSRHEPYPTSDEAKAAAKAARERKRKAASDPLAVISKELELQRKVHDASLPATTTSSAYEAYRNAALNRVQPSTASSTLRVGTNSSKEVQLARMREERLAREQTERARAERLLNLGGASSHTSSSRSSSVQQRTYDNAPIDDTVPHRRKGTRVRDEYGRTIGFEDEFQ